MFQLKNLKKISPEDKKQNIAIKTLYETNTTNTLSANLSSLQLVQFFCSYIQWCGQLF